MESPNGSSFEKLNVATLARLNASSIETLFNSSSDEIAKAAKKNDIDLTSDEGLEFPEIQKIGKELFGDPKQEDTRVTTITNDKGGVGKSWLSFELSQIRQFEGKRVLLIDLDGQANLTKYFLEFEDEDGALYSLANYFMDKDQASLSEMCIDIDENISVIPGNGSMARFNEIVYRALALDPETGELGEDFENIDILLKFAEDFKKFCSQFDDVILDTPPNIGKVNFVPYIVSTHLLVPMLICRHDKDAIKEVLKMAGDAFRLSLVENPIPVSVLFNRVDDSLPKTTAEMRADIAEEIEGNGREILPLDIPLNSRVFTVADNEGAPLSLILDDRKELKEEDWSARREIVKKISLVSAWMQGKGRKKTRKAVERSQKTKKRRLISNL